MKKVLATTTALVAVANLAQAGGVERSTQSAMVLFEQGNYAEFSFGHIEPEVSGSASAALGGFPSGDMADSYVQLGAAYKHSFGNGIDAAIIFDQPFGADVNYPVLGTPPAVYYAAGSTAELNSTSITGLVKYTMPSNISVFGGLRYQTLEAKASIPFIAGYTADGEEDGGVGYVLGAAYEKPEIALRVALTYNSKIDHDLATTETGPVPGTSNTRVTTPQSLNLEFQTGVAPDTLLFGGIRWTEWSAFDISPVGYGLATGGRSLVSYDDDVFTYTLGLGRRLNENWSIAGTLGYEKSNGGFASNLGPTDGFMSYGVGATYTRDNMKITAGIRYVDIGDAQTTLDQTTTAGNFSGNSALGVGVKVGYSF